MFVFLIQAITLCILIPASNAHANGCGLNSEGCHTNRKTGNNHCHRAPTASSQNTTANLFQNNSKPKKKSQSSDSFNN